MLTDKNLREKLNLELNNLSTEELQVVDAFIVSLKQKRPKRLSEPVEVYSPETQSKVILNETLYPLNDVFDEALEIMGRHYGVNMRRL